MKTQALIIKAENALVDNIHPNSNQIYKNVRISVEERELEALSPNDIRIKVCYVGICGTDVHLTSNHSNTGHIVCSAPFTIPKNGRIIGHEGVGQVIEVGANVKHIKEGMYVALESIAVCYQCSICKKGKFNQCLNSVLIGLQQDGLMTTIADIPASIAHNLNIYECKEEDFIAAATFEPAAVAYLACENAQMRAGEKVVIFGAGPIGLYCAMLSKLVFGVSEVHVVDPVLFRRNLASDWADRTYSVEEFFDNTPCKIDVIIEASAYLDNIKKTFLQINANGRVILLGRKGESLHIVNVDHMITNEITIKGSRGHLGGAFDKVMLLYFSKKINLLGAVTHIAKGLNSAMQILNNASIIEDENCKIIIKI